MRLRYVIPALGLLLICGCGGGGGSDASSTATIGVQVTGLVGKLVLQNNGGDDLTLLANGTFLFANPVEKDASYAVTILMQPAGPTCTVSNGSGTATADVTNISVTCTTDPATMFLPIQAVASNGSASPAATGLFVISSKSPGDPPIQITTQSVGLLGLQAQYTFGVQGTVSAGNPYELIYTTFNSSGDNHVWSLDLSGTSTLAPKQLSNLTLPYHTEHINGGIEAPLLYCGNQVIPRNLADPTSAFLILALPTDANLLCGGITTNYQWLLIHSGDGSTTAPVNLPALSGPILPLYRPDGALAGLVAIDGAHNLNFYPDETFANPRLLLANVGFFIPRQEAKAGPISPISSNPTYSFLVVQPADNTGASAVYRVDNTGAISADLYDVAGFSNGMAVGSDTLYVTDANGGAGSYHEAVVRIPGGGAVQILSTASVQQSSWLPVLQGVSGSNLVFSAASAQQQWLVQTLPTGAPGTFTTIGSYDGVATVSLVSGDIFVTSAKVTTGAAFKIQYGTQILDSTGNVLQASTPSSEFVSLRAPILQVRDITDSAGPGGGGLYALDLSQPSSPTPVALKTAAGAAFTFPSGSEDVIFQPITPTIVVADGVGIPGGAFGGLIYDLVKGTVVPVSMPNSNFTFLTDQVTATN